MFCSRCGYKNESSSIFCEKCGNRLKEDEINRGNEESNDINVKMIVALVIIILFILVMYSAIQNDRENRMSEGSSIDIGKSFAEVKSKIKENNGMKAKNINIEYFGDVTDEMNIKSRDLIKT